MYYTEEESMVLLQKLQELLDNSHPSIEAVLVSNSCVYTYSDKSNVREVHNLMDKVAEVFGIDEDRLGGWDVAKKESLVDLEEYFYAERSQ